ncbi:MAG: hypothetical protein Q9168_003901 [Polycauliona sp. 1 TL-2023]
MPRREVKRKRKMILTNEIYAGNLKRQGASEDHVLFCRWKHMFTTKTGKMKRPLDAFELHAGEIVKASWVRLREEECDDSNRISDQSLRESWLGTDRSPAINIKSRKDSSLPPIDELSIHDNSQPKVTPAPYTLADICCGAGGASRGAEMAGLTIPWALDHNKAACDTYELNFPSPVRLYREELSDFDSRGRADPRIILLHGSFPCQAWSRSNRRLNPEKDTLNIAASMELGRYLDMARPRVVTMEQTSGLMIEGWRGGQHSQDFHRLIKQLTCRGFSVTWKILNMLEFGLPQPRKRLIVIATWFVNPKLTPNESNSKHSPGEPPLDFPKPTHAENPGDTCLLPYTSVNEAIGSIRPEQHEIPEDFDTPREPYNGNKPLKYTILTKGARDANQKPLHHPSGLRALSTVEFARLQGFPLEHQFTTKDTKKQIGNAFPPIVAAAVFGSIKRQLLVRDGWLPR